MSGRRRSQRNYARGTLRHLRWSRRLPNSYQANHLGRILLEDYAARLLPFCEEVCLCQIHAPSIHAPTTYLQTAISPWLFSMWAFDVVGPITPSASNGHKYFLAATEYFTKWVETVTLRTVEGRHVVSFIHNNILCRFGIPHDIVSDNGSRFKN